ncbi:MAG TPA: histidine phosphatase family protein, partial [Polyangiaceae bacterium LLY-WYZ-15_(1-7)]|nr:histidine phosphatase family protein [Polyangiaceae bacterium LLY-WYZ-15_(1-7)]
VRHAEAWKNVEPRPEDASPDELDRLTPAGETQARALRSQLPEAVTIVWTSPTRRTRQTAELLAPGRVVAREPALRNLDGGLSWATRREAAARGEDLQPEDGETLAAGASRARALLDRIRRTLGPGESAVLVTHGDFAPLLLGELRHTPLLERPARDALGHGEMACEPLPPTPPLTP